ncbi:membrane protein RL11G [Mandrillus leucophaeus cytomegalovirus]|uniref:Membrane protein RL11G n=1 Tax=Mandrillus leucophaeus cytomegalovirus TaxID=1654930 RepID=A0A0G2UI71_9BETA|nr:membrane protein RL11G [Mandrillus leucophaeus cytomegalovirus]AKI29799.1 membrane protein RL11G [Mandrillus leucophaeus cytomegalovirus]
MSRVLWYLGYIHTVLVILVASELTCNSDCNCNNTCGFLYNVTNTIGYYRNNVNLHTSISYDNHSRTHAGLWIRYNYPAASYALCSASGSIVTKEHHDGWCFECNGTSLTICNLDVNQTGSYMFRNVFGLTQHYTVTVVPVPPPPAPKITTVTNCSMIFFNEQLWENSSHSTVATTMLPTTSTTTPTTTTKPPSTTHRTTAGRTATQTYTYASGNSATTWSTNMPKFISKYSKLATFASISAGFFSFALVVFLLVFLYALLNLKKQDQQDSGIPPKSSEKEKCKKKKLRLAGEQVYHLLTNKGSQSTSCAVENSMFS